MDCICPILQVLRAVIFAPMDQCFATATLFETRCFKRRSFQMLFVFTRNYGDARNRPSTRRDGRCRNGVMNGRGTA
jgi:hypothetical protein